MTEDGIISKRLYTEKEAIDILNVDRSSLHKWRSTGKIAALRLAGSRRCIRYSGTELLAFIERSRAWGRST